MGREIPLEHLLGAAPAQQALGADEQLFQLEGRAR
jgi:hypothetical protein